MDRARADVTEAARHADPVRLHQILRQVVARVLVEALRVPFLRRRLVEVGIGEQAQADDAGSPAVERTDRQVLAARADGHPGIFLFVLERIRRAITAAVIQPQAEARRIRAGRLVEAGLVDQAEVVPAIVAVALQAGIRRQRLQEIQRAVALTRDGVPETIVAARPHDPRIAPLDLVRRQRHRAVHVVEVVLACGGQRGDRPVHSARLVEHVARLGRTLATGDQRQDRDADGASHQGMGRRPHRRLCLLAVQTGRKPIRCRANQWQTQVRREFRVRSFPLSMTNNAQTAIVFPHAARKVPAQISCGVNCALVTVPARAKWE